MSIFDQYENYLPGDKKSRKVKFKYSEYRYFHEDENELDEKPQKNYLSFYIVIGLVFFCLVVQLINLQITQGSWNRVLAEGNRIQQQHIQSPRGIIYDSKGVALVQNNGAYSLDISPISLPKSSVDRDSIYQKINQLTGISASDIKNQVDAKGLSQIDPIILKDNLDRDTAMLLEIKMANTSGVTIEKKPIRNYVKINGLAQVLGYVGKVSETELKNNSNFKSGQLVGKDGLEKTYQNYLQGRDGITQLEVDSKGRAQRVLSNLSPESGDSLTLTMDSAFEDHIAQSLQSALSSSGSTAGVVVAENPQTGAILGMVSLPSYDNNLFTQGISSSDYQKLISDPNKPMFNRVVSGTYPSGSTIKPMMAAAALQEGIVTENTTITDSGEIKVGNYTYRDWKAHGLVDVRKAIQESCDVFFYAIGGGWDKINGLGVEKIDEYLTKFWFGKILGIDLPGEASGLVPSPTWKQRVLKEPWYLGDTYHMSIGQGDFLATPLQLINAISSIANGGKVLKPYLVSEIKDQNGAVINKVQKTILNQGFISEENIKIVQQGMRLAVTSGTAQQFKDLPQPVAAKTGTAQFGDQDKTHAWMVAYGPYDDPTIAVAVLIEGGGEGYAAAGPVVKDALNYYFTH